MAAGNDDNGETPPPDRRLPYEKPAVAWLEKLEVRPGLLAVCQKLAASDPSCDSSESHS